MVEQAITYERLFELLRSERVNPELQKLSSDFSTQVAVYISSKLAALEHTKQLTDETDGLQGQIKNARRIIESIFERREKKIVLLAINKARATSFVIDETAFLPHEHDLYLKIVDMLLSKRNTILTPLIAGTVPQQTNNIAENGSNGLQESKEKEFQESKEVYNSQKLAHNSIQGSKNHNSTSEQHIEQHIKQLQKKETNASQKNDSDQLAHSNKVAQSDSHLETMDHCIVLQPIPEFIGPDMQTYGPYQCEEMIELPFTISKQLLKSGRLKRVDSQEEQEEKLY